MFKSMKIAWYVWRLRSDKSETRQAAACQAIWKAMAARKTPKGNDNIYLGAYSGWYAVRDEAYYEESELTTGPDGKKRAPSGAEVEWVACNSVHAQLQFAIALELEWRRIAMVPMASDGVVGVRRNSKNSSPVCKSRLRPEPPQRRAAATAPHRGAGRRSRRRPAVRPARTRGRRSGTAARS